MCSPPVQASPKPGLLTSVASARALCKSEFGANDTDGPSILRSLGTTWVPSKTTSWLSPKLPQRYSSRAPRQRTHRVPGRHWLSSVHGFVFGIKQRPRSCATARSLTCPDAYDEPIRGSLASTSASCHKSQEISRPVSVL